MNVIHVIPSVAARTGGPAYAALYLARALERSGVSSPVFSTNQPAPAQLGHRSMHIELHLPEIADECDVQLRSGQRVAGGTGSIGAGQRGDPRLRSDDYRD